MTDDSSSPMDSSGFRHLVEAATVLTQLVRRDDHRFTMLPNDLPVNRNIFQTNSLSDMGTSQRPTREVSDDDETLSTHCSSILRENHSKALSASRQSKSSITDKDLVTKSNGKQSPSSIKNNRINGKNSKSGKETFPRRLHALLNDSSVSDVISWIPHGKSFVVIRPDVFATHVLPRYFTPEGSNSPNARGNGGSAPQCVHKYPSFTRKLNRWGFRQVSRGPDAGAFYHELFLRDDPEKCLGMVCQKSRKSIKPRGGRNGQVGDDTLSVSSASTMMSFAAGTRPASSTVSVSTTGAPVAPAQNRKKSLPFKKRRSGSHHVVDNVPVMMPHASSPSLTSARVVSSTSVAGSELTSDNSSSTVSSSVPKPADEVNTTTSSIPIAQVSEHTYQQSLFRNFQEQQHAYALQSLMNNSQIAMQAAGISHLAHPAASHSQLPKHQPQMPYKPITSHLGGATVTFGVFAPTTCIPAPKDAAMPCQHTAVNAKNELYRAYLKALANP
mmetsp:Transcript_402/g.791  ORF Transcript_402/g.791 Transcript_402/m.791 type:complete len:499 (-) Transcript_402:223-1719(-)|eukprot:CAMPEP_0171383182 /NCGR_PEP_ID=MMETSP0879-20121228/35913_1 /TAXON_ID=67004 /ORGANISM="Thalassiosira weissflogii, Strain CCMP1336" /LENGTH=498 /DNA_ID=CAMNT_0011895141 /DNA_START=7 /DNA_END=1503 /DNA_ORIENTATION=-